MKPHIFTFNIMFESDLINTYYGHVINQPFESIIKIDLLLN